MVHKMMAKDPAERYQSVRDVLRDLAKVREGLSLGLAPPAGLASGLMATTAVPEDAPCGVDAVLQKPFDLEKLVSIVARYCSRAPIAPQAAAPAFVPHP